MGLGLAVLGCLAIPLHRLFVALPDAEAIMVVDTDVVLSFGMTLRSKRSPFP